MENAGPQTGFEKLISKGVAENKDCYKHTEPAIEGTDSNDETINCAIDGYFMYKDVTVVGPKGLKPMEYGSDVVVQLAQDDSITFKPLGTTKSTGFVAKLTKFEEANGGGDKMDDLFGTLCKRPDGTSLEYGSYQQSLLTNSDWYHINNGAEGERDMMFIRVIDTKQRRDQLNIGCEGKFVHNILYIGLLCVDRGRSKRLLDAAERFCVEKGLAGILLASMSNSAGAYWNYGYRFVEREKGIEISMDEYVTWKAGKDGRSGRRVLDLTSTPPPRLQKAKRSFEEIADSLMSTLSQTIQLLTSSTLRLK